MRIIKLQSKTNVVIEFNDSSNPKDVEKLSTGLGEASRLCQNKIVQVLNSLKDNSLSYMFVESELPLMLWQVRLIIQVMAKCHSRARLQCLSDISTVAQFIAAVNTLGVDEDRLGRHAVSKYSLPQSWIDFCIAPAEIKWKASNKLSDLRIREDLSNAIQIVDPSTIDESIDHINSQVHGDLTMKPLDSDARKLRAISDLSGYISSADDVVRFDEKEAEDFVLWKIDLPSKGLARRIILDDYLDAFFEAKKDFCK